jgi:type II secretory pathway component PulK
VVLVVVLIVVVALSLAAYSFAEIMLAESQVTNVSGRQAQAHSLAASGIAATQAFLMLDSLSLEEAGGIYDNPDRFQAIQVMSELDEVSPGRFTLIAPALDVDGNPVGVRYGLQNESARLNLNAAVVMAESSESLGMETAGRDLLMALPGMTEDVADAILDWIDEDDEPREFGAEFEYYSTLDPPYAPKNAALETVEELLLVRGITPALIFGQDVNRNGLIDENELARFGGATEDFPALGWSSMLTLHSKEQNSNSLGEPRIDLNMEDLQALYDALSLVFEDEAFVSFIIAYRQNGPKEASEGEAGEAGEEWTGAELDLSQEGKNEFKQVLDLIGAQIELKLPDEEEAQVYNSPFGDDLVSMATYMTLLMDSCTIVTSEIIPGRININLASRELLAGIPGMPESAVEQILSERSADAGQMNPDHMHETWLLTTGIVTLQEMKSLSPFICGGGSVYRAQSVGYFDDGAASARLEVLLDASQQPPAVLLWRDISHLGRGYPLELLGTASQELD